MAKILLVDDDPFQAFVRLSTLEKRFHDAVFSVMVSRLNPKSSQRNVDVVLRNHCVRSGRNREDHPKLFSLIVEQQP